MVNLLFPINNTTSVEVRRVKNDFIVKENILKLYKKEIVVKNSINKNLYSSAMEVKLEPNIITGSKELLLNEPDSVSLNSNSLDPDISVTLYSPNILND